jgi:hypothetical protein
MVFGRVANVAKTASRDIFIASRLFSFHRYDLPAPEAQIQLISAALRSPVQYATRPPKEMISDFNRKIATD